ncbi:MAG: insulinase family protein [Proteiniphilum sp.]|nr:insulinase family protein [Proteiniphilum sp.]MDD3908479.1 insulinase family protein [Proteiniphilum sp.]MDD4415968.1 insulinase family protein [Proteiniphilum sp.]
MNKKTFLLIGLLVQAALLAAQSFDISEALPVDKEFITGRLENGLTYYIRESKLSENRADFFIVHNVGSLQEEENQRGLAHFLEHMAFNGTKNFPGKQLLNYFESIGVRFGANVNAYTSISRTVYNISEVPVTRSSVVDTALLALHDWSHYISCLPEEIESERGVVREEMRRGDNPLTRTMQTISRIQRTGSRFAERTPIGLAEVIENFDHHDLTDFYHKWYRPNLQAVIVVGDIDAEEIEKKIIGRFSSIPNPENETKKIFYTVPDNKKPIVGFFTDPETKASSVRMTVKIPHRSVPERQTHAFVYDKLVEELFLEMFKSRCAERAKKPGADFRVIVPVFGEIDYACKTFTATAMPAQGKDLCTALKGVLEEVERTRQHGMTELELDNAKNIIRASLRKKQSDQLQKPTNKDLVNVALENFTRDKALVNQTELIDLSYSMLDKMKISDINDNIKIILNENNRIIIFAAPESDKESIPSTEKVLALVKSVQNKSLEQYTPVIKKELAISAPINPGKISGFRQVSATDFGIKYKVPLDSTTEIKLENGARVIWKESYGEGKKVRLSAFTPGGYARPHSIEEIMILKNYMRYYNVANLNWNELREWKHTNGIRFSQAVNKRTDNYSGDFYPQKSENFFKLLYSHFTDVSADQTELSKFQQLFLKTIGEEKNETKLFEDSVKRLTYSSNPLKTNFDTLYIQSINLGKLNKLYQRHFCNPAEFTFIFTGPMPVKDAVPLIEKYIASIAANHNKQEKVLEYKDQELNRGNVELYYNAKNTITSKASVSITYHTDIKYNLTNYANTLFLRDILSRRCYQSIREDRGGTYHVAVSASLNRHPQSQLVVNIEFETNSSMIPELLDVVQHEADLLAKDGPTIKEIDEVKKYRKKTLDNNKSIPWSTIITQSILNEEFLDTNDSELLDEVNAAMIHNLAKQLFGSGNKMTFVFDPRDSAVEQ